jgi:arsenite methyltransferase
VWHRTIQASGADVDVLRAVEERYSAAAKEAAPGLCCPVEYDSRYLAVIPPEVLQRDYGCGDPVSQVRQGEHVLDLGCGGGKACFIAAQIVGPSGSVLGVDLNDDMLTLARRAQPKVARQLGYGNITFAKARIDDLALDLEFLDQHLTRHPITEYRGLLRFGGLADRLRRDSPLVPTGSVNVVISNCVFNLVATPHKKAVFAELARVLQPGGRAVISDIVSDIDVPIAMREDPELWSGCYSGAMQEQRFLDGFSAAGLVGVRLHKREVRPKETVNGVEFRSVTVEAYKPLRTEPSAPERAVLYRGPYAAVETENGLRLFRGDLVPLAPSEAAGLLTEPFRNDLFLFEHDGAMEVEGADPLPEVGGRLHYRAVEPDADQRVPGGPGCC